MLLNRTPGVPKRLLPPKEEEPRPKLVDVDGVANDPRPAPVDAGPPNDPKPPPRLVPKPPPLAPPKLNDGVAGFA